MVIESYIKKLEEENKLLNKRNIELEEEIKFKPKRILLIHPKDKLVPDTTNLIKTIQLMDLVLELDPFREEKSCFKSVKDRWGKKGRHFSMEEVIELYA